MRIDGWEVAQAAPDAQMDGLEWLPEMPPVPDVDAYDWWFRASFSGAGDVLRFGGIATVSQVFLNGELVLESESMFEQHDVDVGGRLREGNELVIRCRALAPLLAVPRRPRARWRTQIACDGNLRWFRTTLLGRAPGFAPGPPVVGPWRPVALEWRRPRLELRARIEGDDGLLVVQGDDVAEVEVAGRRSDGGEVRIPGVERWWPHTHGDPVLHEVRVNGEPAGRVGFRTIAAPNPFQVNGVDVFARGALWTPVPEAELRPTLEAARDAGMNMIRIPGTGAYESPAFWDLCDELGLLVWQDFMFANFDYPVADPGFRATVEREAAQVLAGIAGRPSLAVLCGNSEVEQQVAMLGLDPGLGRGELFGELLPEAVRASGAGAPYVPSSPSGGELPFRNDAGVAHYFGVGGYRRPLEDARRAEVRFASECLAIANQPDGDDTGGVPRDVGAGWDFQDVRDHYLQLLFGVARSELEPERYLELSRAVSGEVMAEVFGEWRRAQSPCAGGLVLWLRDLMPGAGWGVLDSDGRPKVAYHHLRRALAPVALWTTDEGLGGLVAHVANDRPVRLAAQLRVAFYRDLETRVEEASEEIELAPHSVTQRNVETVLGRFADASYAYRFGPPQHDAVVVSLEAGGQLLSQSFRFPAGRPLTQESAEQLGLEAELDGGRLTVRSRRLAYGVRIHGATVSDNAFSVEPGRERVIEVRDAGAIALTALNLLGQVRRAT